MRRLAFVLVIAVHVRAHAQSDIYEAEIRPAWRVLARELARFEGVVIRERRRAGKPPTIRRMAYWFRDELQRVTILSRDTDDEWETYVTNERRQFSLIPHEGAHSLNKLATSDSTGRGTVRNAIARDAWPVFAGISGFVGRLDKAPIQPVSVNRIDTDRYRVSYDIPQKTTVMHLTVVANRSRRWSIESWEYDWGGHTGKGSITYSTLLDGAFPQRLEYSLFDEHGHSREHCVYTLSPPRRCSLPKREFYLKHYGITPPTDQTPRLIPRWQPFLLVGGLLILGAAILLRRRQS